MWRRGVTTGEDIDEPTTSNDTSDIHCFGQGCDSFKRDHMCKKNFIIARSRVITPDAYSKSLNHPSSCLLCVLTSKTSSTNPSKKHSRNVSIFPKYTLEPRRNLSLLDDSVWSRTLTRTHAVPLLLRRNHNQVLTLFVAGCPRAGATVCFIVSYLNLQVGKSGLILPILVNLHSRSI